MKQTQKQAFDLTPYITEDMRIIEGDEQAEFEILIYCDYPSREAYALTHDGGIVYQDPRYRGFGLVYEAECQEGMSSDEVYAMLVILARYPKESNWDQVARRLTEVTGIFYPHD